jgi:LysM repeat protein
MQRTLLCLFGLLAPLAPVASTHADRAAPSWEAPAEQDPSEAAPALGDAEERSAAAGDAEGYRVQTGDTLSGIAERLDVSVDELLRHNPDLNPDRIREGQRLVVRDGRRKLEHVVQPGETVSAVLARYKVRLHELKRWNPNLNPDRVRAGQSLLVYTEQPLSRSLSVGAPNQGRLLEPERLPPHAGYLIRERDRAWGTLETVQSIVSAFEAVRRQDPKAPRLKVHDISLRHGGAMTDHHSHQSGRDADIAYYQRECSAQVCGFRKIGPGELDTERTWALLKHWLETDATEAIFVDYALQAPLYRAARADGASPGELRKWFQYPSGPTHPLGVVRHFPRHADHMHVRFVCPDTDPDCVTFRPLFGGATAAR